METHLGVVLGKFRFMFNTIRYHKTPMRREIHEAVEIKISKISARNNLNGKLEYNRAVLPNLCDRDPTQEEKNADKKLVIRIKGMKQKWSSVVDQSPKLLTPREKKKMGQRLGLKKITPGELEDLTVEKLNKRELRSLLLESATTTKELSEEEYLDKATEDLHTTILTLELTGKYYRTPPQDIQKAQPLELKFGEDTQLQRRFRAMVEDTMALCLPAPVPL